MSDLISRSALLKEIAEEYDLNYGEILINPERFYEMVESVPTAYDISKVVAELEKLKNTGSVTKTEMLITKACVNKAIDIVRKGGVE